MDSPKNRMTAWCCNMFDGSVYLLLTSKA